MRFLLLLLIAIAPLYTQAETLRRSYKKPAPEPLQLSKEFSHFEEVKSTCTRRECQTRDWPTWKEFCKDETSYKNVCHDQFGCKMVNGKRVCGNEKKCGYEFVHERKCEKKMVNEKRTFCSDVKYSCLKQKKVVDRNWKVALNSTFDARAVPKKDKDEKFEVSLEGDEHEPKLNVKTLRSSYKYLTEYRFDPASATVNLEFRLDETPAE
jgi:hypothetical protein